MWGRCRRNVPEPRRFARRDLRAQPADGLEGMPSGPQQQIGPGRRFWVYRGLGRDVQNGNPRLEEFRQHVDDQWYRHVGEGDRMPSRRYPSALNLLLKD